ncbi:MAG TPA: hypothetical protein VFB06_12030 [Streptosporangiaceae bacterium]|nr:hypothetical protein [Streptosporangiaceae bacterium]
MTRLDSLSAVLAALDDARDVDSAPAAQAEPSAPRGYRIWESARRQAEFYVAYAEMLEAGRRPRGPGDSWVQEVYPPGQWVGQAMLATAYRRAAQHAALVDSRWATKLAVRAGMAYVTARLPFGLCLLTGLLDDQTLSDSAVVRDLVLPFRGANATTAVRHPVQLTYLLLAAASRPWLRDPLREVLDGAEQRLAAESRSPMGPLGRPLGEYVQLAGAIRNDEAPGAERRITTTVADLGRAQAATLRAAQRNGYLWRQGASPVSIIDLEQVTIYGLALRRRSWFGELSTAIVAELERDDALAQLPVWTMRSIQARLPEITRNVTGIMREPERAWRTETFREPDAAASPWTESAAAERSERLVPDTDAPRTDDHMPGYLREFSRRESQDWPYERGPDEEYGATDEGGTAGDD